MRNIITSQQMKSADEYTIKHLPISSYDLMEKASTAFVKCFMKDNPDTEKHIAIFCGNGNNGGDGFAIARLLYNQDYLKIKVYKINFSASAFTEDNVKNQEALRTTGMKPIELNTADEINDIEADIIIDAILGSGLNKPLAEEYEKLVQKINHSNKIIYSVDIPTGMFAEGAFLPEYNGIKAYKTISFQRPKLNFFFPESIAATRLYETVDIGLIEEYIQSLHTDYHQTELKDIKKIIKPRERFSHKGTFGHALIVAGNKETMGAALLNSMGCLYAGAGLTSVCIPADGLTALNSSVPEAMYVAREKITSHDYLAKYSAIAVGSGLGESDEAKQMLAHLLQSVKPLVIDADALNILAKNKEIMAQLPVNTILTPHMKEFDRMFGEHENWWSRLQTARQQTSEKQIIILLKSQYTFICTPDKQVYINTTGNAAMAQGGMGDVLTGIIVSFLSQGYTPIESAIMGCYLHGKSGDTIAVNKIVATASEVARQIAIEMKSISF